MDEKLKAIVLELTEFGRAPAPAVLDREGLARTLPVLPEAAAPTIQAGAASTIKLPSRRPSAKAACCAGRPSPAPLVGTDRLALCPVLIAPQRR